MDQIFSQYLRVTTVSENAKCWQTVHVISKWFNVYRLDLTLAVVHFHYWSMNVYTAEKLLKIFLKKCVTNYYLQIKLSSLSSDILLFLFKCSYHCWSHEWLKINANANLSDCCWCNSIKYRYLVCVLTISYWHFLKVQACRPQCILYILQ